MPTRKIWKDAFYNAKSLSRSELVSNILTLEISIEEEKTKLGEYSYLAQPYTKLEDRGGVTLPIDKLYYQFADAVDWLDSGKNTVSELAYKEGRLAEQFKASISDIRLHFRDWHEILDRLNDILGTDIMTLYPSKDVAIMLTTMQSKGIWLDEIIKSLLAQKSFGAYRFNKTQVLDLLKDLVGSNGDEYSGKLLNFEHSKIKYDELVKDDSRYADMLKRRYGIYQDGDRLSRDSKHITKTKETSTRRAFRSGVRDKIINTPDYKKGK